MYASDMGMCVRMWTSVCESVCVSVCAHVCMFVVCVSVCMIEFLCAFVFVREFIHAHAYVTVEVYALTCMLASLWSECIPFVPLYLHVCFVFVACFERARMAVWVCPRFAFAFRKSWKIDSTTHPSSKCCQSITGFTSNLKLWFVGIHESIYQLKIFHTFFMHSWTFSSSIESLALPGGE